MNGLTTTCLAALICASPLAPTPTPAPTPAPAPAAPAGGELLSGLEGHWTGTLAYIDYGSGKRVELPARAEFERLPEVDRILARMAFSDPGHEVHSVEVTGFDLVADVAVTCTFSPGSLSEVEISRYELVEKELATRSSWTLVLGSNGLDNGRPAEFRDTRQLLGSRFISRREVRYTDEAEAEWFMRNELRLDRIQVDAEQLVGTWRVSLDSSAFTELTIEGINRDHVDGSFYGTTMSSSHLSRAGGTLRLAFVTSDGSGPYNSLLELHPDGTLSGTTHSVGRDFLSTWTAVRVP